MKNKIIAHLTIILILVGVFCNVCTTYNRISFSDNSVYASADNWTSCDTSDLVTAFRYYCKSRNLALEGSMADALTSFTTTTFNNLCSTLGIDISSLSSELKKTTQGNLGLRFLFSQTGITAYNRIFAEFLQNNDLDVGDEVDNKVIHSGLYFVDDDGFSCQLFIQNGGDANGTPYKYNTNQLVALRTNPATEYDTLSFNINNNSYVMYLFGSASAGIPTVWLHSDRSENAAWKVYYRQGRIYQDGYPIISYDTGQKKYYLGTYVIGNEYYPNGAIVRNYQITIQPQDVDITLNTPNNTVINNNTYNNNYVIIYNGGDTYISDDDNEPLPTTPPSGGGGGGGGDNPSNPDIPPVDPTPTPNPTIPDWDIELPDMPTGNDWLLYGLEKKFPWDIPFNLMYMLSLFAADPETPHFEGTLDLKICQWDYDIDLAPFDDIAGYVRNIEFIGFLIGLMLLTNKLIWG